MIVNKLKWEYNAYEDNIIIIGAHWQGKTYFAAMEIIQKLSRIANIWIWDYHGKFKQYLGIYGGSYVKHSLNELMFGFQVFEPLDKSKKAFEEFCKKALKYSNLVIVVDEAHNYSTYQTIPENHGHLVRDAGNQGISYIEIFQRPAEVHKSTLGNARHRFCFKFDVPNDVQYLRAWLGIDVELFLEYDLRSDYGKITSEKWNCNDMLKPYSFVYRDFNAIGCQTINGGISE